MPAPQTPVQKSPQPGDQCDRCHQPLATTSIGVGGPASAGPYVVIDVHTVLPEHATQQAAVGHYHSGCCPYPFCDGRLHHPDQEELDDAKAGRPAGWTKARRAEKAH